MNCPPFKIALLDCTKTIYNEESSDSMAIGGIERCIIALSRALADKGHEVRVFADEKATNHFNNIHWVSKTKATDFKADIVIACNDPTLFDDYKNHSGHTAFQPYLWHHNPVGFWKTIRKGRLLPLLKWSPTNIFLGDYHLAQYPKYLPNSKKAIIGHGVEQSVLNFPHQVQPPQPHAAFISQAYRGLDHLIQLWKDFIFPELPSAKLFIYSSYDQDSSGLENFGIFMMGRLPRHDLLQHLSTKRLTLIPGHTDETFCLSALESQCLGLPVISFGVGALAERINQGQDGFLVENNQEFAEKTLLLLKNDILWTDMSQKAAAHQSTSSWSQKATLWENLFRINHAEPYQR